jgi:hypothetical protein
MKMKTCNFFNVCAFTMIFSVITSLSVNAQGKLSDPEVASVAVIAIRTILNLPLSQKKNQKTKKF